jgi:hypothetical protein
MREFDRSENKEEEVLLLLRLARLHLQAGFALQPDGTFNSADRKRSVHVASYCLLRYIDSKLTKINKSDLLTCHYFYG